MHSIRHRTEYDIIVVGAGACGFYMAQRLQKAGKNPLLIDAGPTPQSGGSPLPSEQNKFIKAVSDVLSIDEKRWGYGISKKDYRWNRVRAVGGRTLIWGGWAVMPSKRTFEEAAGRGFAWPFSWNTLAREIGQLRDDILIRELPLEKQFKQLSRLIGRQVIAKSQFAHSKGKRASCAQEWFSPTRKSLRIKDGTQVISVISKQGLVKGVEVRRGNETSILKSNRVVLCASPIETGLLLHRTQETLSRGEQLHNRRQSLTDHMVCSRMVVFPANLLAKKMKSGAAIIPRWGHDDPFVLEISGPHFVSTLSRTDQEALGFQGLGEAKKFSFIVVHAMGEVFPNEKKRFVNYQKLESDTGDFLRPEIHWDWDREDLQRSRSMIEAVESVSDSFCRILGVSESNRKYFELWHPLDHGGISHEASTFPMGGQKDSLIDSWGRVRNVKGLTVADASVMPTALDCHPTLALLGIVRRISRSFERF